jgi:hypothetical protein
MTAQDPKGQDPQGQNPASVPRGQVRIYLGAAHRFIWPVHLAGWLELGWTTEPGATAGATPVATAPVKPKKRKTPTEPNPINESPLGANPIGGGSAKEVDPLPPTQISVAATDFTVDESTPTLEADD